MQSQAVKIDAVVVFVVVVVATGSEIARLRSDPLAGHVSKTTKHVNMIHLFPGGLSVSRRSLQVCPCNSYCGDALESENHHCRVGFVCISMPSRGSNSAAR